MPKIKIPKSSPSLDMTPMVDLAFLLVTFFILTASFRNSEPVVVDMPSSISEKLLPENYMMLSIDPQGRVFYNVTGRDVRRKLLEKMAGKFQVGFTEAQKQRFSLMATFGVPIKELPKYIDMTEAQRGAYKSNGIPADSTIGELRSWIEYGRIEEAKNAMAQKNKATETKSDFKHEPLRFAIKADMKTPYIVVKDVIKTFTDLKIYRFNLITNMEEAPVATN
jgi:biopolymer transport protein ExbD